MNFKFKVIGFVLFCMLMVLFVGSTAKRAFDSDRHKLLQKPCPLVEKKDIYGKPFSMQEERGKVVLITFFKIGCEACMAEIKWLNTLQKEFGDELKVVGVGAHVEEDLIAFKSHNDSSVMSLIRRGLLYKVPVDSMAYTVIPECEKRTLTNPAQGVIGADCNTISKLFATKESYPATFVVGKTGIIRYFSEGFSGINNDEGGNKIYQEYKSVIERLMQEKPN